MNKHKDKEKEMVIYMIRCKIEGMRQEKHWTIEQLSQKSGVPLGTVKHVLYGETADLYISIVYKLVKAMGGTIEIVEDSDAKNQKDIVEKLKDLKVCIHSLEEMETFK
jgi:transcriptional regulator with XRE-family HTH domain